MMKRLVWFILAAGLFLHACHLPQGGSSTDRVLISSFTVAEGDPNLRLRNGVLLYTDQPFSGVVEEFYPNGQVKAKTEYRQGREHGTSRMWYEDGRPLWERRYRNGKKHGEHKGWWPNGQLKFLYHFAGGEHEGAARDWYANGQLAQCFQYEKGQEAGLQQAWRENGKLYINYVVKAGKRYGLVNSRLCYTVKDGEAQYDSAN
jgi:antitoxin component YwqK of YwqJK toxin-antitoxin module